MQFTPGSMQQVDARFGQRLTTAVDLHKLGASPELQVGLETLRGHIHAKREGAIRGLFVGARDSGQALAAASLGKAVEMAVFRIDLSAVVSRYIGETEKNLDRIFGEAGSADAILFFDEADSLFGKRTDVHDAHDRHANAETAYLLRKLDAHAGPVIFATSSRTHIDPAFLPRLRYVVNFDTPAHRATPAGA